jgi:fructokinase
MRYDLTTLGELVIDLVPVASPSGTAYLPKPGGAPANVAAGAARLGLNAAMITKVGSEAFGRLALGALEAAGVATEAVVRTDAHNTALAVVSLTPEGERDFFFYRENCADANFAPEELPLASIRSSRVLHVGSLWLASPISAAAQRNAVATAADAGVLVSADPNFRPAFWREPAHMIAAGRETIRAANVVKLSEEELLLLAGSADAAAARSLWHDGLILAAVTRGPAGADLVTAQECVFTPGFSVATIDTIGCGDAFLATLLCELLACGFAGLDRAALARIGRRASAAGALMATVSGALESMPTGAMIDRFLADDGDP